MEGRMASKKKKAETCIGQSRAQMEARMVVARTTIEDAPDWSVEDMVNMGMIKHCSVHKDMYLGSTARWKYPANEDQPA